MSNEFEALVKTLAEKAKNSQYTATQGTTEELAAKFGEILKTSLPETGEQALLGANTAVNNLNKPSV